MDLKGGKRASQKIREDGDGSEVGGRVGQEERRLIAKEEPEGEHEGEE